MTTIELKINGENRQIPKDTSAEQLVEILDLVGKRIAIEVNQEILPRSQYAAHLFKPGDRVEVVTAIGGG